METPRRIVWPRWTLRVTATLAAVMLFDQAVFAGQFLSGSYPALEVHRENASYAGVAVLVAAVAAVLQFRPGRGPWWPIAAYLGLFVLVGLQIALGFAHALAAHVPLGVAIILLSTALAVWSFGITGAATWGVLAFFGNFLPYIGGLVATALPIVLAYLEFDTILHPTLFAIVLLGISGVTSNLIEPAMTGKALDLSPLVVMIGLAFWSLLWGIVGMCLAIPLTVVLKIILEHTPATRPIGRMLGESQRPG